MIKPTPPLGRLLREGWIKICSTCGSSLRPFYYFKKGCIQPLCINYWNRENEK